MIRALTILICVCVYSSNISAQENNNFSMTKDCKIQHIIFEYRDMFEWFEYFDDYNAYIYDSLDIVRYNFNDTNNIWQVVAPNKGDWITGGWQPYPDTFPTKVLITDSLNPYPINNFSTVEFYMIKPAWTYFYNFCWSFFTFNFRFKCETDTLQDGFYVEVSFDGGQTFANAQDTTGIKSLVNGPTYIDPTEMIVFRTPLYNSYGVSGTYETGYPDGWHNYNLTCYWDNQHAHDVDTAIIRLNFISDSINTNKRGVIIDNVNVDILDQCIVTVENNLLKYTVNLFPNPLNDNSLLHFYNPNCEIFKLDIVDNNGKLIYKDETSEQYFQIGNLDLKNGIYYYRLSNKYGEVKIDKFLKLE